MTFLKTKYKTSTNDTKLAELIYKTHQHTVNFRGITKYTKLITSNI